MHPEIVIRVIYESVQAERDAKRYTAFEKKAALTAQAERMKTSMKESQLVTFRAETKSRYAPFWFCFQQKSPKDMPFLYLLTFLVVRIADHDFLQSAECIPCKYSPYT